MRNIEVTKREVFVSIVIVLLMLSIGFLISTSIHNSISVENEKYFKSLKVNDNPDLFNHGIDTEVGNMLSYGTFKANEPVSDQMIKGKYFSIIKIEEEYVQKTRTVTYTDSNGKTRTRIETYWEWEEQQREQFNTKSFTFLKRKFDFEIVKFSNHTHNDTIKDKSDSYIRYVFETIPSKFDATLFSKAESKSITQSKLFPGQSIEKVIKAKESEADNKVTLFWVIWTLVIIIAIVAFVALDNRALNKVK